MLDLSKINNVIHPQRPYRVSCRCNFIIDPLGDKNNINLSFRVKSVTLLKPNEIGRAYVDLFIYKNNIKTAIKKTRLLLEDTDNLLRDLEDWVFQILAKLEFKITEQINDDNAINMINELFEFRRKVREAILSEQIKVH